ncbi:lysosomal pro-x carboxypeptidase [Phtheirospermum japonicum]|uniref:Lysosomal pro-x carboxypeptidase n=1 Tax=Phtheirospermum japonicum TaxID=374723 RepID=A0A830CY17_9LAMI|nr:lysosomal pro-x carboxypeptidase [Phtheirospermum japonicum]
MAPPLILRVIFLFQLYSFLLPFALLQIVSTFPHKIPKLSPHHKETLIMRNSDNSFIPTAISDDFKTYYYTQTLDHFNYAPLSYATFKQRYVINSKYWGGPNSNSPIFAYLGAEDSLDDDLGAIGFLNDNAPNFKSLSVFIEHRYYGKSIPFGTMEKAMKNETTRGYFNSAQAIADYAEILLYIKKNLSALYSPIIVVGGSYGGMLASWFRLKYPHIALGALASSAPILYFDNITPQNGYYSIVTEDFKEISKNCYQTIRKSWAEIDKVASKPGGLSILSQRFKTCSPLNNSGELKDFLDSMYATAAQYDAPPEYPVSMVCKGIDNASNKTDVIEAIFAGVVSYWGDNTCYDTNYYNIPSETSIGWRWQTCSEMVIPIGRGENDTMFPASPFNLHQFSKGCMSLYGVPPRPHWITTYYGGHDTKLVLKRFGSNIIFSNGLRDPYSSGGVLEDISDSVVVVTTLNGSHCLDILPATKSDPKWLVIQRKIELKIIKGWLTRYYSDFRALKK